MCGICGVVALDRPAETRRRAGDARTARHRGPDGERSLRASRRRARPPRLAIIDLTDGGRAAVRERGRRSAAAPQRRDLQLPRAPRRARGRRPRFRTATDTEVVLARVSRSGATAASSASTACGRSRSGTRSAGGSSARATASASSRSTTAGTAAGFVFASEPKAFSRTRPRRAEPNVRAVRDFLEQGYADHLDETFFEGIHQLPRRTRSSRSTTASRVARYWQLEPRTDRVADSTTRFSELFLDAVRLQLRSDVPVGTASRAAWTPLRSRQRSTTSSAPSASGATGRATPADVHRLLRGRGLRRAPVRRSGRGEDGCRAALDLVHDDELVDVLPSSSRPRASPSARRASSRNGT